MVSASSSFLRFIRSLSASASRLAIWILVWMLSFVSAMPAGRDDAGVGRGARTQGRWGRTGARSKGVGVVQSSKPR